MQFTVNMRAYIYIHTHTHTLIMADCFEGSVFETEPADNPPTTEPPSSVSLSRSSVNMRHFRRLICDSRWFFSTQSTLNTQRSRRLSVARCSLSPAGSRAVDGSLVAGTAPTPNTRISDKSPGVHSGSKSQHFRSHLHFRPRRRLIEACAKDTKMDQKENTHTNK